MTVKRAIRAIRVRQEIEAIRAKKEIKAKGARRARRARLARRAKREKGAKEDFKVKRGHMVIKEKKETKGNRAIRELTAQCKDQKENLG